MKCCKLFQLCIFRPDFEKYTSLPLTYIYVYKCSFTFVELYLNIIIHCDITCGMGSKTCKNMISILKPLKTSFDLLLWERRKRDRSNVERKKEEGVNEKQQQLFFGLVFCLIN